MDPFGLCKQWWEKLEEGYYYGTGWGAEARDWYAAKWAETGNWWWAIPGAAASAWTSETYQATAWTVLGGAQWAQATRATWWQYRPKNNPNYQSDWIVKGRGGRSPYKPGQEAREALNLPRRNPGDYVKEIKLNPGERVAGPRAPKAQPEEGWANEGKGQEYYRGDVFPD